MENKYKLHLGDCLEVLKTLPSDSVDAVVTDPPAGIGFLGKEWDHHKGGRDAWIAWMQQIASEALRVLKPGGHALVWSLPRTSHWTATAWENAGFECRDVVAHLFGTGFPKSLDVSKAIGKVSGAGEQWQGWGTALKPAREDWWLLRKPLIGTVADNVMTRGTGALNIDGCRIEVDKDSDIEKAKYSSKRCESGASYSTASHDHGRCNFKKGVAVINYGDSIQNMLSKGRWPANVTHDGSEVVLDGFPESEFRRITGGGKRLKAKGLFGMGGDGGENVSYADNGSAARYFYCAKASKRDRDEELEKFEIKIAHSNLNTKNGTGERLDGKPTGKRRNVHPTVKSTDLMRYLCRLITPPNGIVLDPFMGSGSTGKAAMLEGFRFIGIEREQEYFAIAEARVSHAAGMIKQDKLI